MTNKLTELLKEIQNIANQYRDDQVVTLPAPYFKALLAVIEKLIEHTEYMVDIYDYKFGIRDEYEAKKAELLAILEAK